MAKIAAQDEFVDLYEVLEVPESADTEQIRQRVNALYLEAQQNLDHRNVKKRLQFQQLYEIYLPQARHLLLDSRRRAEYDRYLQAYRTGSKVASTETAAPVESTIGDMGGAPGKISDHDLPEIVEQEVDPEQLAAEREAMWAKWKTGLEAISEQAPAEPLPGVNAPAAAASHATAPPAAEGRSASTPRAPARPAPRQVVPRFDPNRAPRTARPAPRIGGAPEYAAPNAETVSKQEKQREQQRFLLIKNSVQNAGLIWGIGIGAAVFVVGCAILFTLDNTLKPPPLKLSRPVFDLIGFFIVLLATAIGGLLARKKAKRRAVAELSLLSLEELLRRSR
jgi:hypothetical protein